MTRSWVAVGAAQQGRSLLAGQASARPVGESTPCRSGAVGRIMQECGTATLFSPMGSSACRCCWPWSRSRARCSPGSTARRLCRRTWSPTRPSGLSAAPCGFLIARAKPTSPIGWLFLGLGLAALGTAAMVPLLMHGDDGASPSVLLRLGVTVFQFSWGWGVFCFLPLALQLFPTGRPLNERWRALCWLTVATAAIGSVTGPTPEYGASSYLAVSWWRTAEDIVSVLAPVVVLLSVASLVLRFKRGDDVVRRQLLWLVAAVLLVVGVNVSSWFSIPTGREILLLLTFPLIPVAVTIAVLRHGLYDVRLVVSRLLAYGILSAGVVAIYLALVAVLDRTLRPTGAPVLATLAVALAFNPVRLRLQRLADRALFGLRRDPVLAVSAVGRRLAQDDLAGVLETLRDALRLPYVAIHSPGGTIASGVRDTTVYELPLLHQGEPLGTLEVGARRGERRLSKADDSVLELLATPLAVALHATTLTSELQASRNLLIEATEHERQRLHRELHDSLGPLLTGAALKADGAALAARHNPERAGQLATELAQALRDAIVDVRHLVYGLRPPALDEHGLVDALRLQSGPARSGHAQRRRAGQPPHAALVGGGGGLPDRDRGADQRAAPLHRTAGDGLPHGGHREPEPDRHRRRHLRRRLASRRRAAVDLGAGCRGGWRLRGRSDADGRPGRRHASARSERMIRLLIADDHPMVRDGLRALFDELPDIEVVGEAANGREAVEGAVVHRPDVMIMDLAMPDVDGFAATSEIKRVAPEVAVLVLTMSEDDETVAKAMRAGAQGYLLKGATKEEILRAVTSVAGGEAIFGSSVARRVLARLTAPPPERDPFPQLTPREHDVLHLLASGLSNPAIAARLELSLKTINNLTSSVFAKLHVAGRTEAALLARDHGLGRS